MQKLLFCISDCSGVLHSTIVFNFYSMGSILFPYLLLIHSVFYLSHPFLFVNSMVTMVKEGPQNHTRWSNNLTNFIWYRLIFSWNNNINFQMYLYVHSLSLSLFHSTFWMLFFLILCELHCITKMKVFTIWKFSLC